MGSIPMPATATPRLLRPVPTHTVPGELHQIRAYVEATRTRIGYLEQLLGPRMADDVSEIKGVIGEAHETLERLRKAEGNEFVVTSIAEIAARMWHAYRRLVSLEERLQRVDCRTHINVQRPSTNVPTTHVPFRAARRAGHAKVQRVGSGEKDRFDPEIPMPARGYSRLEFRAGLREQQEDKYMMSGALPCVSEREEALVHQDPRVDSANEEQRDRATGLPDGVWIETIASQASGKGRGRSRKPKSLHYGPTLHANETRWTLVDDGDEVAEKCRREEAVDDVELQDPDRKREGSTEGNLATFMLSAGFESPRYFSPKLSWIKGHEVREVKKWLAEKRYLRQSDGITRTEKLFHLLLVLQEGCRMETVAVQFSRTPRQVQHACREVFEGLLEMHSETWLGARQPACDRLWKICQAYFNAPDVARKAELYYGWELEDVLKVLVTLNMCIARFRMQGKFALDGPYYGWWKHHKA